MLKRHKTRWCLFALGGLAAIAIGVLIREVQDRSPILTFQTIRQHDVVTDAADPTLRCTFDFVNEGTEELRIMEIKSSCGCTAINAGVMERAFAPGEKGSIRVEMHLGRPGVRSSQVLVYSNGSNSPHHLEIEGTFIPSNHVEVIPDRIALTGPEGPEPVTSVASIEVLSTNDEAVDISSLAFEKGGFATAEVIEHTATTNKSRLGYYNHRFRVLIRSMILTPKSFSDRLIVQFRPSTIPPVEAEVDGEVLSEWRLIPSRAIFVFASSGDILPSRKVVTVNLNKKPFSIAKVVNPFAEWLEAEPLVSSDETGVAVVLTAKTTPRVFSSHNSDLQFVVSMADGTKHTLYLPVSTKFH